MCTHDRLQVFIPGVVWRTSAHLLLLMTVLSTQLSSSPPSFKELLMLSKLQQCEVDGSNYKVSCVRALWLSLSSLSHLFCTLQLCCLDFCEVVTERLWEAWLYNLQCFYLGFYLVKIKNCNFFFNSRSTHECSLGLSGFRVIDLSLNNTGVHNDINVCKSSILHKQRT